MQTSSSQETKFKDVPPSLDLNSKSGAFVVSLIAGGLAGIVSGTAVAPFERIKTILQVQHLSSQVNYRYVGMVDAWRGIVRNEGFLALWKGNGMKSIRLVPNTALRFGCYDLIKHVFKLEDRSALASERVKMADMHVAPRLAAGAAAGLTSTFLLYPSELIQARLSSDQGRVGQKRLYGNATECYVKAYQQGGVRGLFRGCGTSLLGVAPLTSISMAGYDFGKVWLARHPEISSSRASTLQFCFGAISGLLAQSITYPIDTVRRRLQVNNSIGYEAVPAYTSARDCFVRMYRTEGFRSFWSGLGTNALQAAPRAALQYALFDWLAAQVNGVGASKLGLMLGMGMGVGASRPGGGVVVGVGGTSISGPDACCGLGDRERKVLALKSQLEKSTELLQHYKEERHTREHELNELIGVLKTLQRQASVDASEIKNQISSAFPGNVAFVGLTPDQYPPESRIPSLVQLNMHEQHIIRHLMPPAQTGLSSVGTVYVSSFSRSLPATPGRHGSLYTLLALQFNAQKLKDFDEEPRDRTHVQPMMPPILTSWKPNYLSPPITLLNDRLSLVNAGTHQQSRPEQMDHLSRHQSALATQLAALEAIGHNAAVQKHAAKLLQSVPAVPVCHHCTQSADGQHVSQ